MKLTVGKFNAGDFDREHLSSYIIAYHTLYPKLPIYVGEKPHLKMVVFEEGSPVLPSTSESAIPERKMEEHITL